MFFPAKRGETIIVDKFVGITTSRDTANPVEMAVEHAGAAQTWESALEANQQAWAREWERCDVEIEGGDRRR
jgi:kojibiose phosphorylase